MEPRTVFLRGEVAQPLWLPPGLSGVVQTYRHGGKHTPRLLVYYQTGTDDASRLALNMLEYSGTLLDAKSAKGGIVANSITGMSVSTRLAPRKEDYMEKLAVLCEGNGMDAFYAPIDREPGDASLVLVLKLGQLYFLIGDINGDYGSDTPRASDITVATSKLVTPGDKGFTVP